MNCAEKKTRLEGGSQLRASELGALPFLRFTLILLASARSAALQLVALEFFFAAGGATLVLRFTLTRAVLALPGLVFAASSLPVLFVSH